MVNSLHLPVNSVEHRFLLYMLTRDVLDLLDVLDSLDIIVLDIVDSDEIVNIVNRCLDTCIA